MLRSSTSSSRGVSVVIVTLNSEHWLGGCLGSLGRQTRPPTEVIVVDNGSTDGSVVRVRELAPHARVIELGTNTGFAAANNRGIEHSGGEWVFLMNTDVVLEPDYIERLVGTLEAGGFGWGGGKLLRLDPGPDGRRDVDSAGEIVYRTWRMANRGADELDDGRFDRREGVFGVTAAAAIYSRRMLDDIAIDGEWLVEDLFSYLEDCDLNWRARLRGWRCLYEPNAVAFHGRQHAQRHPVTIRRHAFANRWLNILQNASTAEIIAALPELLLYDGQRLLRAALRDPGVLPGIGKVLRLFPRILARRRHVQSTRTIPSGGLGPWLVSEDWGGRLVSLLRTGRPLRAERALRETARKTEASPEASSSSPPGVPARRPAGVS